MPPLEVWVAAALMAAILLFGLAGGADFGGGIWTALARGENAEEQGKLVDRAIGPVWEANELWIIVAVVILWAGFPDAFVAFGISLFIPFTLVLVGILLRGAFFAFRQEGEDSLPRSAYGWLGRLFGAVSFLSPFFFGVGAGAIASGRLSFEDGPGRFDAGTPVTGYFSSWIGLFPLIVGVLAVVTTAYLAANYLTLEAVDDRSLQEDFRLRGLVTGAVLGVLGVVALPVTRAGAPYMWDGISGGLGLAFMVLTALALIASIGLLFLRRYWWARTAAIAQVSAVFGAWAVAQYPYLLVDDITITGAASPRSVLIALLILAFLYAIVLGPSLVLLFSLFKRHPAGRRSEH